MYLLRPVCRMSLQFPMIRTCRNLFSAVQRICFRLNQKPHSRQKTVGNGSADVEKGRRIWAATTKPRRKPAPNVEIFSWFRSSGRLQMGQTRLQSVVLLLHPTLFQVKSQRQEEKLCPHVRFPRRQKSPESEIGFEQRKGAFCLYGPAQPQVHAFFGSHVCF